MIKKEKLLLYINKFNMYNAKSIYINIYQYWRFIFYL